MGRLFDRYLSLTFPFSIILARNEQLGKQAVAGFEALDLKPKFHQLDITDKESRSRLADFVKANYPAGIDILVNNAGIAYKVWTILQSFPSSQPLLHPSANKHRLRFERITLRLLTCAMSFYPSWQSIQGTSYSFHIYNAHLDL